MTLQWRVVISDPGNRLDIAETETGAYRVEGTFFAYRASYYRSGVYTPPSDALIGCREGIFEAVLACEVHYAEQKKETA
jgi:hypothetical protein